MKPQVFVIDVDGVMTDGSFLYNREEKFAKRFSSDDHDALTLLRPHLEEGVPLTRVDGAAVGILRTPGLYVAEVGGARSRFAMNTADPQRSNVARTSLAAGSSAAPAQRVLERSWWMGCAMAAFVLALVEWWTWQRRLTV